MHSVLVRNKGAVSVASRMSCRKSPTPSVNDILAVENVDLLTMHVLAELFQDKNPKAQDSDKQNSRGGAVKAGVIRHTSSPNQPLAFYYIRK